MEYSMRRSACPTPMIKTKINTAANWIVLIIMSSIISGCTIIPTRNTLNINKTIDLDQRALDNVNVGIRMEWVR